MNEQQQHGERYRESKECENLGLENLVDLIPDFWIFDYGF